jgi:hypothetical protein
MYCIRLYDICTGRFPIAFKKKMKFTLFVRKNVEVFVV